MERCSWLTSTNHTKDTVSILNAAFDIRDYTERDCVPDFLELCMYEGNGFTGEGQVSMDLPVTFKVLEKGSQRGGRLLVSSDGYSYTVKRENQGSTLWRCSKRSANFTCHASVSQRGGKFKPGVRHHIHMPDPRLPHLREISAKVKETIKDRTTESAMKIVKETVTANFEPDQRFLVSDLENVRRAANRYRRKIKTGENPALMVDNTFKPHPVFAHHTHDRAGNSQDDILDVSFDVRDDIQKDIPVFHRERCEEDDITLHGAVLEDHPVTFRVLEKGSKRGGRLLVSSDGYSYTVKRDNLKSTIWTCSKRSASFTCHAIIIQRGALFKPGSNQHIHIPDPNLPHLREISAKVKESIKENTTESAMKIVKETIAAHSGPDQKFLALDLQNLKRAANLYRRKVKMGENPASVVDNTLKMGSAACPVIANHSHHRAGNSENDDILDDSFDVRDNVQQGGPLNYRELCEEDGAVFEDLPVTFRVLEKGSQLGGRLLVSSDGYTYTLKKENQRTSTWRCSKRSASFTCNATVIQCGGMFKPGSNHHIHMPDPHLPHLREISAKVKETIKDRTTESAMKIVKETVLAHFEPDQRFLAPDLENVRRAANRYRRQFTLARISPPDAA